jgi:hypothetical protein
MTVLIWLFMNPNWRYFPLFSQSNLSFSFCGIGLRIELMLSLSLSLSHTHTHTHTFWNNLFSNFDVKGGLDCICGEARVLFWCCSQWACHQWWGNYRLKLSPAAALVHFVIMNFIVNLDIIFLDVYDIMVFWIWCLRLFLFNMKFVFLFDRWYIV